jgi:tetratricopeptide (TPR) repeat protein
LDSVFAEWDKLIYDYADKKSDPYFVGRRSFLNGQKRFLARQAVFLIDQAPDITTDFEYNRVADAFSSIGDFDDANKHYLKAIEVADGRYTSVCIRAYARSLFWQGRFEEGRGKYQESIALISLDNDVDRFHTAETYQRWAMAEADFGNWNEARRHIDDARGTYTTIKNRQQQFQGLENLSQQEEVINAKEKATR